MKNFKSKIASLLSVALLGTSLIVPSVFADETTEEPAVTTYKTAYEQDFTEQGLTKDILKSQGWTIDSSFGFGTSGLGGYHTTSEQYATYDADAGSNYKLSGQLYVSYGNNGMICEMATDSAGKAVSITFKANQPSVLSCNGNTAAFDMTINGSTTYTYTFECNDKTVTATLSNGTTTETKSLTLDSQIMPYVRWTMKSYSDMKLKSMKLEVPSDYPLYKTVYEQNFQQAGLTVDDVTSDGWVINNMTPSTEGLRGVSGSSAIYTGDLGTKYKVSGSFWFAANGVKFYYGGTVKDGAYSGGKQITMDRNTASSSKLDGDVMNVAFPQYTLLNYEFTCNENVVTFLVKKSDGTVVVNQSKTYNSPLESNCIRWYFDGYVQDVRLYNIKIKVADDYKEYVTTYNRTFTYSTDEAPYTEDEIKAEGWVYSDNMSPTKSGLYAKSETNADAYAWYNKDLGTEYIADLVMTRNYYGSERYFFNATLESNTVVKSGFAVENGQDWGDGTPIILYKYVNGTATKVAESTIGLAGQCPLSIHIEYDNGKIFVKETKASDSKVPTITYDATADIANNPELASGIIGGRSSNAKPFGTNGTDFYAVRSLTVQQPDTENKLSTLIVNVADDNTVTYSVKGNNKTSEKLDAIIIVAAYDVNGQLLGVDISGQYIGSLGVQAVTGTFACSEAPANVKAFLIDGFKNLRPLASAILKNIE